MNDEGYSGAGQWATATIPISGRAFSFTDRQSPKLMCELHQKRVFARVTVNLTSFQVFSLLSSPDLPAADFLCFLKTGNSLFSDW
jgi:hypothetical protein